MLNFGIKMDRDKDEKLKIIKGGDYRFELRLKDEEDKVMLTISGCRFTPVPERIVPPVVYTRYTAINIITLSPEIEKAILDKVKSVITKEEAGLS